MQIKHLCRVRFIPSNMFKPSSNFLTDRSKAVLLFGSFLLFVVRVFLYLTVLSVPRSLVITCWERAHVLALLCVMHYCVLSLSHMVSWLKCGT